MEIHLAVNSVEDAIYYVKKIDENGNVYPSSDTLEVVNTIIDQDDENTIISVKEIIKNKIELDGIV